MPLVLLWMLSAHLLRRESGTRCVLQSELAEASPGSLQFTATVLASCDPHSVVSKCYLICFTCCRRCNLGRMEVQLGGIPSGDDSEHSGSHGQKRKRVEKAPVVQTVSISPNRKV